MSNSMTDGELLARFARAGDEVPFQELLQRHGQMIFQVCWRVLAHSADAEDAAQAVFLTLAQKAGDSSLQHSASLAGWLHRLAWHIAMRVKSARTARRKHEREASRMVSTESSTSASQEADWERLRPLLDAAVAGLPEKYRLPFVLCHLEGRTQEQAAELLLTPRRTLSGRLDRARELLRRGLERHGAALPAGVVAGWPASPWGAAMPPAFVASTSKAASLALSGKLAAGGKSALLAHQALQIFFWKKVAAAAAIVIGAILFAGGAAMFTSAFRPPTPVAALAAVKPAPIVEVTGRPDDKPKVAASITITPRTGVARRAFQELSDSGLKVSTLSLDPFQHLSVPLEFRFKPVDAHALVEAVATARRRKVAWFRDGRAAVIYPEAPTGEVEKMTQLLASPEVKIRREAAWQAGAMLDVGIISPLLTAVKDPDAEVARLALVALRRIGWEAVLAVSDQGKELVAAELVSPNAFARVAAAAMLGSLNPPDAALFDLAYMSPDRNVRQDASKRLKMMRGPETLPMLEKFAAKGNAWRASAISALGYIGGDKARALIESALDESALKQTAIAALGRIGGDAVRSRLEACLADPAEAIREEAACALARSDATPARAGLEKALMSGDVVVRRGATRALAELTDARMAAWLGWALADPDETVRVNAARALAYSRSESQRNMHFDLDSGHGCHASVSPEEGLALVEKIAADPARPVRLTAPLILADYGGEKVRPLLEKLLADPIQEVREMTVASTAYAGLANLTALLEKSLVQRDTRSSAAYSLVAAGGAEAVERLKKLFDEPGKQYFSAAVYALEGADPEIFLPLLAKLMNSKDRDVRTLAVKAAVNAPRPLALKYLTAAIHDPDKGVQYAAIEILNTVDGDEALKLLESTLESNDYLTYSVAVQGIGSINSPVARELLERTFAESKNGGVRAHCLAQLCRMGSVNAAALAEKALDDPNKDVRESAAESISQLPVEDAARLYEKALASRDDLIRAGAAGSLSRYSADLALPLIERLLGDAEWRVRHRAASSLSTVGVDDSRAFPQGNIGYAHSHSPGGPPKELVDRALKLVEKALVDPVPHVRSGALYAMKYMDPERTLPLFQRALADGNERVRETAVECFAAKHSEAAEVAEINALTDPAPRVRRVAARMLHGPFRDGKVCASLIAALKAEQDNEAQSEMIAALNTFHNSAIALEAVKNTKPLPPPETKPKAVKPPTAPANDQF